MQIDKRTIDRVTWRLLPLLMLGYFVCYLDRANIGVAALTMNKDIGLSAEAFGFGAGIFFFGYFIFEVPSNLVLDRVGARRWIARIMITWGLVSGAMAFVGGPTSFAILRFLLGAAEAGFFPGVIYYLTLWFPSSHRARMLGYFGVALPLTSVIGTPISAALLGLDGALGLKGWQWLFLIEALPSILLAFYVWRHLTDRPAVADWLSAEERTALTNALAEEKAAQDRQRTHSIWQAMTTPAVLALSVVYLGVAANSYALAFFLPQIVKAMGFSNLQTGFVSAIPFLVGAIGMVLWSHSSDRTGERRIHTAVAFVVAAAGMACAAAFTDPMLRFIALCVGALGTFSTIPVFWTLPSGFLTGAAAAAGIAAINSIGNIAGFGGPYAMGFFKERTGDFAGGLYVIAGMALLSAIIVLALSSTSQPRAVAAQPQAR